MTYMPGFKVDDVYMKDYMDEERLLSLIMIVIDLVNAGYVLQDSKDIIAKMDEDEDEIVTVGIRLFWRVPKGVAS